MITLLHYYLGTALLFSSLFSSLLRKPGVSLLLNSLLFLTLFHAHLSDNFLLQTVYSSSHAGLPFYYKIIASWTTHEGSMILWIWSLSLYLFAFSKIYRNSQLYQVIVTIQSYIISIFLLFVIYSSNPFKIFISFPSEGLGLNPILQDTALMIHPPILYLGYVGTSLCFSIAIGILLAGRSEREEFKMLNFFLLVALAFLTLGIALGGWWSYRELGWGGFWSWDPIENVSLLPWLLLLGALHSSFISMGRGKLKGLSTALSILAFISAIAGTFITRMGITDSLHTFNTNTESGIYLLIITVLLFIISIGIFIARYSSLCSNVKTNEPAPGLTTYFMLTQSLICILLFVAVFLATLAPTVSKALGYDSIYIAQSFYNSTFGQLGIILAVCICVFVGQKGSKTILTSIGLTVVAVILSLGNFSGILTAFLSISGMMTILSVSVAHMKKLQKETGINGILANKGNAFFLTHLGFGLFLYAVAGFSSNSLENKQYFKVGDQLTIKTYTIRLTEYNKINNDLYSGIGATFIINRHAKLAPELRFYKQEKTLNTESATLHGLLSDLQIVISGVDETLGLAVETYYKEKIQLIWLSLAIIICGITHKLWRH